MKRNPEFPELPRFGLRLFLNQSMKNVTYCGMGPYESYADKCRASSHGIYSALVENMHEDYIRPQENGSHSDCDFCIVENDHLSLMAVGERTFSFNASPYTQEELTAKNHNYELEPSGYTVLCLDYAQNGIGSNSCGPEVLPKYKLDANYFEFDIQLMPKVKKQDNVWNLVRI